jgi:iron complex outermembrane receptor protein
VYRFALCYTLFAYTLIAATLDGLVQNAQQFPVSFAVIENTSSGHWSIADENGRFSIQGDSGDSLLIKRYGYHETSLVVTDNNALAITLLKDPIPLGRVESTALQLSHIPYSKTYQAAPFQNGSIASLFNQLSNAQLRTYGGMAGNTTISLDGGPGSHTKVVYEGIDITSPQNGEADISQLPPEAISSIAIAAQPGVFYGSGTTDGIIYLKNNSEQTSLTINSGNWGRKSWTAHSFNSFGNYKTHFTIGQRSAEDNYTVTWRDKSFERQNNSFNQNYAVSSYSGSINQRWKTKGVFLYSGQDRGVAGLIYFPSLEARREDELMLIGLNVTYLFSRGFITSAVQRRQSDESYSDPDYNIDSRHKLEKNIILVKAKTSITPAIALVFQGNSEVEKINSSDTDAHSRENFSTLLSSKINVQHNFTVQPTVRIDKIGTDHRALTYNLDLTWQQSDHLKHIISAGNSFRAPAFNDMYWNPGGNADLKPEKASKLMAITSWQKDENNVDITCRYIESKDLIQWIPGTDNWYPENIAETVRKSLSTSGSTSISFFTISGFITRLWTRDLQQDKALRYVPELSGNLYISTQLNKLDLGISGRYNSARIAMYDYPEDLILPPHFIPSIFLKRHFKIFKRQLSLGLSADNILDTQFETINGYPEPGRSINFTLIIQ